MIKAIHAVLDSLLFFVFPFAAFYCSKSAHVSNFYSGDIQNYVGEISCLYPIYSVAYRSWLEKASVSTFLKGSVKYLLMVLVLLLISIINEKDIPLANIVPTFFNTPEIILADLFIKGRTSLIVTVLLFAGLGTFLSKPLAFSFVLWGVYFTLTQVFFKGSLELYSQSPNQLLTIQSPQLMTSIYKFVRHTHEPLYAISIVQLLFFTVEIEYLVANIIAHISSMLLGYYILMSGTSSPFISQSINALKPYISIDEKNSIVEIAFLSALFVISYHIHISWRFVEMFIGWKAQRTRIEKAK